MNASAHRSWLRAGLLFGLAYFLIGRLFALPTSHVHAWRLAAWGASGAVYAVHIGYEHFRLHNSPHSVARHVSVAVAIGAVALAIAGMAHSLSVTSSIQPNWLLALAIWPLVTAVPAYLVARVAMFGLTRTSRQAESD